MSRNLFSRAPQSQRPLRMSFKTLSTLAAICAVLSVIGAIWAAAKVARTDDPVSLLVGPLAMMTGLLAMVANRKKREEGS